MSKLRQLFTLALVALGFVALAAEKCTDCITFSADKAFGIRMAKNGAIAITPNLEYSTDKTYWSKFDLETGAAAGVDNTLYIRGTNNMQFAEDDWKNYSFTNTADSAATAIACSGNIMTLLDYQKVAQGEEPTMGEYAFDSLFRGFAALTAAPELPATNLTKSCYVRMFWGCTSLTSAPVLSATTLAIASYSSMFFSCTSLTAASALPATTLAKSCYASMFKGCTSLTAAPELPATTLAASCYSSMFQDCTSLTSAPALPATNLAQFCCSSMFQGCTSLVVNTNASGKAWSIPSGATEGMNWNSGMFAGTFGNIADAPTKGKPEIGTTYYVVAPVKIPFAAPTEVANATYKVCMGGEEVTDGMVWSNRTGKAESPADPVATVVYTANKGYAFEDGTTEKTIQLDTCVSPAVLTGEEPGPADKTELQLGVVAQRYPWNGIVDINYKTAYWPKKDGLGAVEITANGQTYTNTLDIFATGKGKTGVASHAVDLKWLFGETRGNAQFKALVSDQPIGLAEVKPLAAGEFPAEYADKACKFRSMDTVTSADESQVSPFGSWTVDLYVSADSEIAAGTISFACQLPSTGSWMPIPLPAKLEAGTEVAAIKDWVAPGFPGAKLPPSLHYCSKTIKEFCCGVKNLNAANTGKKLKVTMRLTSFDPKDKTTHDIATVETTLAAPAE